MNEEETLAQTFDSCMTLFDTLESTDLSTASDEFQNLVKAGIHKLENSTHMVNTLSMFSTNESVEEVPTSNLKYLLLPALLGFFNDKLKCQESAMRLERLHLVELYYKDFLQRCRNYQLPNVPETDVEEEMEEGNDVQKGTSGPKDIKILEKERQAKINNYKKMKELETKMQEYKSALYSQDEELVREYFMLLLKSWILRILDEMASIKMEKSILIGMPTKITPLKKGAKRNESECLKPVIIVRTDVQKKVYGLGYPSVPVMTVDEFYKQRYPEQEQQKTQAPILNSLQNMAIDPEADKRALEAEAEEKENNADDLVSLRHDRDFDDWKDDNPRGAGNRKNRG